MALDVLVLTAIFGSKSQSHLNPSLLGPAHHLASPPCGCSLSGRLFPGRPHSWLSMNRGKSLLEPEALRGGCHTPSGAPQPSLLQGNTLPASPVTHHFQDFFSLQSIFLLPQIQRLPEYSCWLDFHNQKNLRKKCFPNPTASTFSNPGHLPLAT